MYRFVQSVRDFLWGEEGATATEYAVMVALIIIVCITSITALGRNSNKTYSSVGGSVGSTTGS